MVKLLAAVTVAYALSPVDLIPNFIPVLGFLNDVILLPALVVFTARLMPNGLLEQCRKEDRGLWANGKPKRWYYAVPVVLVWLLILFWILSQFAF